MKSSHSHRTSGLIWFVVVRRGFWARENGATPARWAISCSPRCQCMASTARQGMLISSATFDHISALNLIHYVTMLQSPKLRDITSHSMVTGVVRTEKTFHITEPVGLSSVHPICIVARGNSVMKPAAGSAPSQQSSADILPLLSLAS